MISCSSASPSASRSRSRGRSRRSRPLAFSTAPFCHDAYASQNQVVIAQALASSPCRANAVSLSSVIEDRSRGSSRRKTAIITASVSAADLPASLAASTKRVSRSSSTSTGRVRLQIKRSPSQCPASLRAWTGSGRSWIERRPAMVERGCRARRRPRRARPRGSRCYGASGADQAPSPLEASTERPMPQRNDLSRSDIPLEQQSTLIAVVEMSQSSWLVAGIVPGLERHPLKKLAPDEEALLRLLHRWRDEAARAGRAVTRVAVAFEAGRDGFWLARWLRAREVEAHVIHPTSVAVSREHRRAKTDRLDTELLKRAFLGWLRGEPKHCSMVAIPTLDEEDAKRPSRERENLVSERTRLINRMKAVLARLGIRSFKPELRNARSGLRPCPRPRAYQSHRIPSTKSAATWPGSQSSASRSKRSSKPVWSAWSRRQRQARMPWCASWPASPVLAWKRRTCWCRRSCGGTCGTEGLWRATLGSRARPTKAAPGDGRRGWPNRATPACAAV